MNTTSQRQRTPYPLFFGAHYRDPYLSQPGLGAILGSRVLAEFGDDPHRYVDTRARKNYSGIAPITRTPGESRAVLARYARNRRLADALYQQTSVRSTDSLTRRGPTTTPTAPAAKPTTKPYAHWPTGSSASCTAASPTTSVRADRTPPAV